MRESAKNVSTRHSTPTADMPHAVRMAAPLAPFAASSPASENTPPPRMSVMTVVTSRKMPRPPCGRGVSTDAAGAPAGAASIVDADWCDAEALMGPPFLVGLTAS